MKYYFSNNCYYDSERDEVFRNDESVKITSRQKKLLKRLLERNGHVCSHEELYTICWPDGYIPDGYKTSLANLFTRKKETELGLLFRIPEIKEFYKHSKADDGGYKLTIPEEKIVKDDNELSNQTNVNTEIWHDKTYFDRNQNNYRQKEKKRLISGYLKGDACSWPIIFSDFPNTPVRRDIIDVLKSEIENNTGVIALTGAGGEEKTTILMQLCAELYYADAPFFYHVPTYLFDVPDNVPNGIFIVAPLSRIRPS